MSAKKHSRDFALFATLLVALPLCANAALKITTASQVTRPTGAEQISGITWAGDNLYYAVDDNDKKLYPLTLNINLESGKLAEGNITIGTGVEMTNSSDMEGCAFDPASGKVWISQETSALIREFDPADGKLLRTAPVPAIQKQYVGNYSLEALTISGDGMTMWTANEEALKVDGNLATNSVGSVVRLTRFTRESVYDNWTPDGEWAYETQPIGTAKDSNTRSGVSGLCALPDGTLLVLERRCYAGGLFPDFNIRIYQVNFSGATDVSSLASLKNASYVKTGKTLLWQYTETSNMPNYEGMCLGPRLDDGSCIILLVSDAGSYAEEGFFTLKLSGLNVRTVNFSKPQGSGGKSSIIGGPYRYMDGTLVNLSIDGVAYPSAYTNNAASCTNVAWTLSGGSSAMIDWGTGTNATFEVTEDSSFTWGFKSYIAATAIDAADSFENYDVGANALCGEVGAWVGDAEVVAARYTPPDPPGYPMPNDAHTKVLSVEDGVCRKYSCTTNGNDKVDMMLSVTRRSPEEEDVFPEDTKVAVTCAPDGRLMLWCRGEDGEIASVALSGKVYANGDWVRMSIALDSTTKPGETYALVRIDGEACSTPCGVHSPLDATPGGPWHRVLASSDGAKINELQFVGALKVDDVIKTTEEFEAELSSSTAKIDGVPVRWLDAAGLGRDPAKPIPAGKLRSLGYLVGDVYDAGLDPALDEPFNITGMTILDDGRLEIAFNGVREDLGENARTALYPVYRMETIGGTETPVAGTTEIVTEGNVKRTVWTSDDPIDEAHGFYRVKVNSSASRQIQ